MNVIGHRPLADLQRGGDGINRGIVNAGIVAGTAGNRRHLLTLARLVFIGNTAIPS